MSTIADGTIKRSNSPIVEAMSVYFRSQKKDCYKNGGIQQKTRTNAWISVPVTEKIYDKSFGVECCAKWQ